MVRLRREAAVQLRMLLFVATGKTVGISSRIAGLIRTRNLMSAKERKAYISAVQCMIAAPSKSDPVAVPGARTRYDDFVGQHINQTLSIHGTGNFLSWHRYFVHGYEKALKEECGFKGAQPYWNWLSYQGDLKNSPVFDGSAASMGGDGSYLKHNGSISGAGNIWLPSGNGGGCIKDGPFKK
jgi:tyrosinase